MNEDSLVHLTIFIVNFTESHVLPRIEKFFGLDYQAPRPNPRPHVASVRHEIVTANARIAVLEERMRETCAICLLPLSDGPSQAVSLACDHLYHENCVVEWFEHGSKCPTCRE